jgi:hypothetical protein
MRESPSGSVLPSFIVAFDSGIPIAPGGSIYSINPPVVDCEPDAPVTINRAPGHFPPGGTFPAGLVAQAFTTLNQVFCLLVNVSPNPITLPNQAMFRVTVFPTD